MHGCMTLELHCSSLIWLPIAFLENSWNACLLNHKDLQSHYYPWKILHSRYNFSLGALNNRQWNIRVYLNQQNVYTNFDMIHVILLIFNFRHITKYRFLISLLIHLILVMLRLLVGYLFQKKILQKLFQYWKYRRTV